MTPDSDEQRIYDALAARRGYSDYLSRENVKAARTRHECGILAAKGAIRRLDMEDAVLAAGDLQEMKLALLSVIRELS